MMMNRFSFGRVAANRGFSLVEIMVALVIGMIGVLVIMQVARTGEAQKRVTVGAGETQTGAALALHAIQSDVKQAGYGFNAPNVIACSLTISSTLGLSPFVPIRINPAGIPFPGDVDANTDTLLIAYGNSSGAPEGDTINEARAGVTTLWVMSAEHYRAGDRVFVTSPAPVDSCSLTLASVVSAGGGQVKISSDVGAKESDSLFNLGNAPKVVAYAVRGGNLTTCDYMDTDCSDKDNWQEITGGVVSLRVQYSWKGGWHKTLAITATDQETIACEWSRVNAIRLALVVRNGEWNRDVVTPDPLTLTWAGNPAASDGTVDLTNENAIDLTGIDGWQHYRYQVYEAVIPLRNIPWMGPC